MKSFFIAISCLIIFFSALIPVKADTDENNGDTLTENNAVINVYAAYDVFYWTIESSIFQEIIYDNDPYKVKQIGIRTSASFVSLGLEYSNTTFSLNDNPLFGNGNDDSNHFAEMIKLFNQMRFGDFSLYFAASHQEYVTTASSDQPDKMYYYTKNAGMIELKQDDEFEWSTEYTKYEMRGEYNFTSGSVIFLGASYMVFDAPTEVELSKVNSPETGRIILFTENEIIDIHFGGVIKRQIEEHVYSLFSVSGSLLTFYYPESSYFDINYKNPLSFDSFSISGVYSIGYSLNFTGSNFRIETGIGADISFTSLSYKECEVKQDMVTADPLGDPYTFYAGERVDLDFDRNEIFWGYYIKGSVFF